MTSTRRRVVSSGSKSEINELNQLQKTLVQAENGFIMSSEQLHELWQYEFTLAHQMLGLPMRQCSAKPSMNWGVAMEDFVFQRLKANIRTMWARAAEFFSLTYDDVKGFGIKVNDFRDEMSLTENNCVSLGWLSVCPSLGECETAHRYLRSPIGTNLYLAGPISLANWSATSAATVKLRRSTSKLPELKNLYYVKTVRQLSKGTEILWNYGILREKEFPLLDNKWFQPCCSETNVASHPCTPSVAASILSRPTTPRGPWKRECVIASYRYCTVCGLNLDENGKKTNMKAHLVSHHAIDISEDSSIHGTAFLSKLHAFCKIIECLHHRGYHIMPACLFFRISCTDLLPSNASSASKCEVFAKFKGEAQAAFRKYQVIYLKGVAPPVCYEDLLPSHPETNYTDIMWKENSRPPHGLFSVGGRLTDDESITLERTIISSIQDIVHKTEMGL